jgi:hypothetical protein
MKNVVPLLLVAGLLPAAAAACGSSAESLFGQSTGAGAGGTTTTGATSTSASTSAGAGGKAVSTTTGASTTGSGAGNGGAGPGGSGQGGFGPGSGPGTGQTVGPGTGPTTTAATTGAGGGKPCLTCNQAIQPGANPMDVCQGGTAEQDLGALDQCTCVTGCKQQCGSNVCAGQMVAIPCGICITMACGQQLQACQKN